MRKNYFYVAFFLLGIVPCSSIQSFDLLGSIKSGFQKMGNDIKQSVQKTNDDVKKSNEKIKNQFVDFGKEIKTGGELVGKTIVDFGKNQYNDWKTQALSIKDNAIAMDKAFKSGNVKEGFKDFGKVVYKGSNLANLGMLDTIKNGGKEFYKGAKAVHDGDKNGWKEMGMGLAQEASVAATFIPAAGEEMSMGVRVGLKAAKIGLQTASAAPTIVKTTNTLVEEGKVLSNDIRNHASSDAIMHDLGRTGLTAVEDVAQVGLIAYGAKRTFTNSSPTAKLGVIAADTTKDVGQNIAVSGLKGGVVALVKGVVRGTSRSAAIENSSVSMAKSITKQAITKGVTNDLKTQAVNTISQI